MKEELKEALYACINPKDDCEAIRGLFYDFGRSRVVASDSNILAVVKDVTDYPPILRDKIALNSFGVNCVKGPYPSIESIIPPLSEDQRLINLQELKKACNNIPASPDKSGEHICLSMDGILFYPPRILKAIRVLEAVGEGYVVYNIGKDRIQLFGFDSVVVIMAICYPDYRPAPEHIERYTVQQALRLGEAEDDLL
jgi:hypothetical protein